MNDKTAAMPGLIYGTAWKKARTADLLEQAIMTGFRGVDTACQPKHYHEPGVGEALQRVKSRGIGRESLYLQTKYTPLSGHDPQRIPYAANAPVAEQIAQSFAVSQKNLHSDYIDALLLHSPISPYALLREAWQALEHIQQAGKVGLLGISNCYDLALLKKLYADASVKPRIVQNRFYRDTGYDTGLRQWCRQQGVTYQSFWTLTANPHILQHPVLQNIARQHAKTTAQVFFCYLSQTAVVPLTGTSSVQHMAEDLAIFEFKLSAEEQAQLSTLLIG
jgi:diketogulonate reductase-like aldo/keto reductase